jgi:hypothetical protein
MDMDRTACYRAISTRMRVRRPAVRRRRDHWHLLPADLSGAHAEIPERFVLCFRCGGTGGRLSSLPALPAGSIT